MTRVMSVPLMVILWLAACSVEFSADAERDDEAEAAVQALVTSMSEVWNAGNMSAYLDLYVRDDRTTLIFADVITAGWENISDLYTTTWSTEEKMGDFDTERVSVRIVDADTAIANGIFRHQFTDELVVGAFSLVARKVDGGWKIVHEHTSRARRPQ